VLGSLEVGTWPPPRGHRRRHRVRAAQQAFAAAGRHAAGGRAALHAGAFRGDSFTCEFNVTGDLWTSRVTSHVPLREVASLITPQAVGEAVHLMHDALVPPAVPQPRIAVSGLNPHAGDGGSIGMEEIELIAPAVEAAARRPGLAVARPLVARHGVHRARGAATSTRSSRCTTTRARSR
jgi:4-hydroxy-L-threonine phosphate dehydrogenase PdxA